MVAVQCTDHPLAFSVLQLDHQHYGAPGISQPRGWHRLTFVVHYRGFLGSETRHKTISVARGLRHQAVSVEAWREAKW